MRAIVTGGGGFVGGYLVKELLQQGREVVSLDRAGSGRESMGMKECVPVDVRDAEAVARVVSDVKPEEIYHLAGISSVAEAWENPGVAVAVNVLGTLNVLEAVRKESPTTRTLCVTSAAVYGRGVEERIGEHTALEPVDPYGSSKACADQIARQYGQRHGLHVVVARPFNHTGPAQRRGFVVPDFASQLAAIEAHAKPPTLVVGNLDVVKDFADVRDVVRAYVLALERTRGPAVFNVCTGRGVSIRSLLETLLSFSDVSPEIVNRSSGHQGDAVASFVGDPSLIMNTLGWAPERDLNATLEDVLNWWRARAGRAANSI